MSGIIMHKLYLFPSTVMYGTIDSCSISMMYLSVMSFHFQLTLWIIAVKGKRDLLHKSNYLLIAPLIVSRLSEIRSNHENKTYNHHVKIAISTAPIHMSSSKLEHSFTMLSKKLGVFGWYRSS